jgi:mannosyltransferase OCH1-like enzyme
VIPKRLHHIWVGPKAAPKKLMNTWTAKHPDWEYVVWMDHTKTANGGKGWKNQAQIDLMPEWCGKADMMRYEILLEHGGVFMDADSRCMKPLDDRFLTPPCWACYENEKKAPGMIANGGLGAEPGSPLMKAMVDACSRAPVSQMQAWRCVGPVLLTRVAENFPELEILPARHLYPFHWTGATAPGDAEIFAEQYWCGTRDTYFQYAK